jgi:F-type H+-transporting ATPase subunit b
MILKPLVKKMEERKKMIDESVDNAKAIETNLQMSQQKFQEKIDEGKVEANKIIGRAQDEADGIAGKMKEKAQADVEELIKQAKTKIGEEKDKMVGELKKETGALVMAALEKVLGQKIDEKTDKKLIEDALSKLK